jgi:hypothetical protein
MFKNGIDPKAVTIFGMWTSILMMIAATGQPFFDGALPHAWVPIVTKWCMILAAINSVILTGGSAFSSPKAGPWVSTQPVSVTGAVIKVLLVACALSFLLASNPAVAA